MSTEDKCTSANPESRGLVGRDFYPVLDPLVQHALCVLDLPPTYTRTQLLNSASHAASRFLSVTGRYGLTPADAARRMGVRDVPASLGTDDARGFIAWQLYKNHLDIDVYVAGGAGHDFYKP